MVKEWIWLQGYQQTTENRQHGVDYSPNNLRSSLKFKRFRFLVIELIDVIILITLV